MTNRKLFATAAALTPCLLAAGIAFGAQGVRYDYLDDTISQADAPVHDARYPKVMLTETLGIDGPEEQFTKYDLIGGKAGMMGKIGRIQQLNPDVQFHYEISPRAYQGFTLSDPCNLSLGLTFKSSGNSTKNCQVYSGHWLYAAGTRLAGNIGRSELWIPVQDASKISPGGHVVIYDGPAGSFTKAEHALVKAVYLNSQPNYIELASRGFKSTPYSHSAGAIIAQHALGRGNHPENWAYNMSLSSPRDASGNTMAQAFTEWMELNLGRKGNHGSADATIDGIYFDADRYFINSSNYDVNNDLVVDDGFGTDGTNLWGDGLEALYRMMRESFPDLRIIAGERQSRGFDSLNGLQMETFPVVGGVDHSLADYGHTTGVDGFDSMFQRYNVHLNYHKSPDGYVENLSKAATKLYHYGNTPAPDNSAFRLAFASTLLGDGYYGQQNSPVDPDPWYDEFSVDVDEGSPSFGHAMPSNPLDESKVRAHKAWLGAPLGDYVRLYDPEVFAPYKSLIDGGHFEILTSGWTVENLAASRTIRDALKGLFSAYVPRHKEFAVAPPEAQILAPAVNLEAGKEYTLTFAAKAKEMREISVNVQGSKGLYLVPPEWTRIIHTFKAEDSGRYRPRIMLGREDIPLWLDEVYLFEGNANVFSREFTNGIVVVNATPSAKTVDLGEEYLRIKGTGQDPINDGSRLTSVTLPAYDAAILVRPAGGPDFDDQCGRPEQIFDGTPRFYIWPACSSPGRYYVASTKDNGVLSVFQGQINASTGTISVQSNKLEDDDKLELINNRTSVDFALKVSQGSDEFSIKGREDSDLCLNLETQGNIKIFYGLNATQVGRNLNLRTGRNCNS